MIKTKKRIRVLIYSLHKYLLNTHGMFYSRGEEAGVNRGKHRCCPLRSDHQMVLQKGGVPLVNK